MNRRQFIVGVAASLAAFPLLGVEDKAKYKVGVDLAKGKDQSAIVLTFGTLNGDGPFNVACSEIAYAQLSEDNETAYFYLHDECLPVHRTVEIIEDSLYLDLNRKGNVCGIETLDKETTRIVWNANCLDKGLHNSLI